MRRSSQSFAPHHLSEWDVNHDGENVDRPSVLAQNECKTLQQENRAYAGDDPHEEDVGRNQSYSLVNQNHMSDG
jgi:hypothetical protein